MNRKRRTPGLSSLCNLSPASGLDDLSCILPAETGILACHELPAPLPRGQKHTTLSNRTTGLVFQIQETGGIQV